MLVFEHSLKHVLKSLGEKYAVFNYPQQLYSTASSAAPHLIWSDLNNTQIIPSFQTTTLEVLKRRNKPKRPCLTNWMHFDDFLLNENIEKIGCRAPYQEHFKEFPICDTKTKMKESILDPAKLTNYTLCQSISNVVYQFNEFNATTFNSTSSLSVFIRFPHSIKIITQSRLVDIQALIGYVGGYIGLFLGTYETKIFTVHNFYINSIIHTQFSDPY